MYWVALLEYYSLGITDVRLMNPSLATCARRRHTSRSSASFAAAAASSRRRVASAASLQTGARSQQQCLSHRRTLMQYDNGEATQPASPWTAQGPEHTQAGMRYACEHDAGSWCTAKPPDGSAAGK